MGQVLKLQAFATPLDETISGTVRALISGRGLLAEHVAAQVGMNKAKMYSRLRGSTQWQAVEVANLSRYFGVRLTDLYNGMGGQFGPQDPDPAGSRLGESNPGPSHYKSHDSWASTPAALATVRDIDTAPSLRDELRPHFTGPATTRRHAS